MEPTDSTGQGRATPAFEELLNAYLLPLLFGARISGAGRQERGSLPPVSCHGPHRLRVATAEQGRDFFTIERAVPFTEEERVFVERVIKRLFDESAQSGQGREPDFSRFNNAVEWAIAHRISAEYAPTLHSIFQIYKEWSAPENRGSAHSAGVYFSRSTGPGGNFFSLRGESCLKAMGASSDTLLALGRNGAILSVETIPPPPLDQRRIQHLAAPLAFADLALWTSGRKAAVRLCPDGRILVFFGKRLLFMRRDAYWRSYPHTLAGIDELLPADCPSVTVEVRRSVYLSCLDLAFAGQEACIGILPDEKGAQDFFGGLGATPLLTAGNLSGGAKLMAGLIKDKKFQDLPRSFRMEMAAMDGALVMDGRGRILSAGAGFGCRHTPDQSPGREAAKSFSGCGLGVSVSSTGAIEIFGARLQP
ncbi:hypothetical protein LJB81_02300 [Desulfovibrio sp. OttesenSCG-928-M14]|nr:hypothetical protein [Desulfovibrio sp. OttesenSCG-928-M14]